VSWDIFVSRVEGEWSFTKEDLQAFLDAKINLGHWVCIEDQISFSGRIYDDLLFQITGQSLFSSWTPPTRVKEIYNMFMRCDPEEEIRKYKYNDNDRFKFSVENIWELRKFFRVCAERDLGLIGD
jgi:hypothetical protein